MQRAKLCRGETMEVQDQLKAIPSNEWVLLRDIYKRDWPRHQLAYNTIQNYINWSALDPRIKQLQILGFDDSWRENGTCVILVSLESIVHV